MDKFGDEKVMNARAIGSSPLGNNSIEGTADGHAAATETTPREVPLVFDSISGTWVSKLSRVNQEDREVDIEKANRSLEDQRFLRSIGFE